MPHKEARAQTAASPGYIKIPADLHQAVKIQATLQRREMQEIAAEAVRDWLHHNSVQTTSIAGGQN